MLAEALHGFLAETIEKEIPAELRFLQSYDAARAAMRDIVDLPEPAANLFLRLCLQKRRAPLSSKAKARGVRSNHRWRNRPFGAGDRGGLRVDTSNILMADTVLLADAANPGATNRNQWYVAISRGRKRALVFTSDKDGLRANIQRTGERRLALELKAKAGAPMEAPRQQVGSRLPAWTRRAWATIQRIQRQQFVERCRSRIQPEPNVPRLRLAESPQLRTQPSVSRGIRP
jgi:hypothetical protein